MTYRSLFDLKFKEKIPTLELEKRFPQEKKKISRLALLELPLRVLKSVVRNPRQLAHILRIKKCIADTTRH